MDRDRELERLQERIRYQEEVIRHTQEALDMVATLGDFQASVNAMQDPGRILAVTDERVRRIMAFTATAYFLISEEDATFNLALASPAKAAKDMRSELDRLADNKTMVWALDSARPVTTAACDGQGHVLVKSLTTASRIRGLFMGRLASDPAEIPDSFSILLAFILQGCANAIESYELYRLNRQTTRRLEEKVSQLVRAEAELTAKGQELEESVARLKLENALHCKAREDLHKAGREAEAATEALAELARGQERLIAERTAELTRKTGELEAANAKLHLLDEMKSAFLSTVSHDIRTPLTSVLGFAKLVQRDFARHYRPLAETDPVLASRGQRLDDNLSVIVSEGERLTRMINDFLDLSRIESGGLQWRDQDVDPAALLETAARAVSGDYEAKPGVDLVVRTAPDLPRLRADPDRMVQVLVNLLHNAVKFTEQGLVRASVFAVKGAGGLVRFEVADTGLGIPAQEVDTVFDKFRQIGRGAASGEARGSGLGLAICREIVAHYNGRIWVESAEGRGSTFFVELPAAS